MEATARVEVSTDSVDVSTADQLVESVQVAEDSLMSQVMSISKSRPGVAVLPWKCTWLGPMVIVMDCLELVHAIARKGLRHGVLQVHQCRRCLYMRCPGQQQYIAER